MLLYAEMDCSILRERPDHRRTALILDSQSVRTTAQGGEKGFDAGKKVKGRKRHLVTDTLGLIIAVLVTSASVQDSVDCKGFHRD